MSSKSDENINYINPATGEILGQIRSASEDGVRVAFETARSSLSEWSALPIQNRIEHILRGHDWLLKNLENVAEAISVNNGKPKTEAMMADVGPVLWAIQYLRDTAHKALEPEWVSVARWLPWKSAYRTFQPLGVVGVISPWNYPFSIPLGEVLTALIAGNCVLLKPSEVTSHVNRQIQAFFNACELPSGVFQMIEGDGHTGAALTRLPLNRIVFTGSVPTGKKVMAAAAENLVPVSLELGGKDPVIVLEDADLEVASSGVVAGAFFNNGQTCCSLERLLVHESIEVQFLQLVRGKLAKLRVGRSVDFQNDIGPFTYQPQKRTLKTQLDEVRAGQLYDGVANFMVPTVLKVEKDSQIWREESFGPVLAYRTFKTDADAIEQANDTRFGLGSVIWTRDIKRARALATKLRAGSVVINDAPHTHALFSLPWGGIGDSGIGRVHGAEGLREMSHSQVVCYDLLGQWKQFWWFPYSEVQFRFLKSYTLFLGETTLFKRLCALLKTGLSFLRLDRRL